MLAVVFLKITTSWSNTMTLPISLITVSPIYTALLGLFFVVITLRVGMYRVKTNILIGDGADKEMLRLMRGQANFVETVPITLILLVMMELNYASEIWMHSLCAVLLVARVLHYIGLTELGPMACRAVGMLGTVGTIAVSAIWLLYTIFLA
jgi:uncharacterized membrane protein YecN with MAPEG domain